ncbi:MAG: type II secretion system F family protein [Candidatus Dormibacterales bacterium]
MLEAAAACAALGAGLAVLALGGGAGAGGTANAGVSPPALVRRLLAAERGRAESAGWPWLSLRVLVAIELGGVAAGGLLGFALGGVTALGLAGAVGGGFLVRAGVGVRARDRRHRRQDAVLESIRLLRQLLETGGVGVQQCLAVLAERGPEALRPEFSMIAGAALTGRQAEAWAAARARVAEPVFDLLAAAVLVQRPGGGALAPLFSEVEATVTAVHEVQREAEALQVQARSAARIIASLPIVFLAVLTALRSPYLAAYHTGGGQIFLAAMLAVMGASYLWMMRWLRLPEEPRMELLDG